MSGEVFERLIESIYKSPLDPKVKYEITEFLKGRYLKDNGEVDSMLSIIPFKAPEMGYREIMAEKIMKEITPIFIKNNSTWNNLTVKIEETKKNIYESLGA